MIKHLHKLPTVMWGGFLDGRLDLEFFCNAAGNTYGVLYRTRKEARLRYEDVRRVRVSEHRK